MGSADGHNDHQTMPLTLPAPPDLGLDFWEQPDIAEAVALGELASFLLAVRGARRARWSQDQLARWTGFCQATISALESGKAPATERHIDRVFCSLRVPGQVTAKWGSGETTAISRRGVTMEELS